MSTRDDLARMTKRAALAESRLAEEQAKMEDVRKGIEALYVPHAEPLPDDTRLGNGLPKHWYCKGCREQWPCKSFNQLRALHKVTYYGGEMKEPVELRLELTPKNRIAL